MVQEHHYGLQTLGTGGELEFIRIKHLVTALLVRTMPAQAMDVLDTDVLGMAVQAMDAQAMDVLGMAAQALDV